MSRGLLAEAAHLVLPDGIVSTGWPAAEATCRRIGITFDPWQHDLNRCILAKDAEGFYAADTVVLSMSRQVGKTYDIGALVFADSIINPGTTTVWTAHRFKVARESFNAMRSWAKSPLLRPHIDYDDITTGAGNETIPFLNGSRIVFAARERGAIRGFTKVRRIVLDEAQILTEQALSDLAPTQNQADNPQMVLMGTPPKPSDPGEVFTRLREEALGGEGEHLLYVEFSAPDGCDLDDRLAWRAANPSYPHRTTDRAMLRMRKLLSDEDFRREALGIWPPPGAGNRLNLAKWARCADPDSRPAGDLVVTVAVGPATGWASIGLYGLRDDGLGHFQLVDFRPGHDWIVPRLVELRGRVRPVGFGMSRGTAALLDAELARVDIRKPADPSRPYRGDLRVLTAGEMAAACGQLIEAVRGEQFRYVPAQQLDEAARNAKTRLMGDAVAWAPAAPDAEITPLVVLTVGRWLFETLAGLPIDEVDTVGDVW